MGSVLRHFRLLVLTFVKKQGKPRFFLAMKFNPYLNTVYGVKRKDYIDNIK